MNYCNHIDIGKSLNLLIKYIFISLNLITSVSAQEIDILLKGGHVIDSKNGIDTQMDIAIVDGKISQVNSNIPENQAKRVLNV